MSNEMFCMGCMQPISEFSDSCYHCGYPIKGQNPHGYLPVRTQLSGRYVVGRALEKRTDAIMYIGFDKTARNVVLIREFFPKDAAQRLSMQVVPAPGQEGVFEECLDQFRKQARTIARLRDVPAMIPVYDLFEENGTMYVIADRVEGVPLRRYMQTLGGHMKWEEARPMFVPLITSLMAIHSAGLYHLGISPDSIVLDSDNRLRLDGWQIPFARTTDTRLTADLPAGYAAPEQYREEAVMTQAVDVYAVSATMLYALTGEEPPSAVDRINKTASLMVPAALAEKWPSHIAPTVCEALALSDHKRIRTVEILRDRLTVAPVVEALREEVQQEEENVPVAKVGTGYKVAVTVLSIVCAVLAAAIGLLIVMMNPWGDEPAPQDPAAVTTTTAGTTVTPQFSSSAYAVEQVVGMTVAQARAKQLRGNMSIKIVGTQFSDTAPEGVIVSQDPSPETPAEVESVIEVYISAGTAQKALPDIRGWERAAAKTYLEALGYVVSEVEITVSNQERGRVDTTVPAAGTKLSLGDEVVVHISNVPTTTTTVTTTTTTVTRPYGSTQTTSRFGRS